MQLSIAIELKILAVIVGISIVIAVIISLLPKKQTPGGVYWTAQKYFEHLNKQINLTNSISELQALQALVEGFRAKGFRDNIYRRDRRKYYKLLKETYELKERNLILHPKPQQLCKS